MTLQEIHEFIEFVHDKEIGGYSTPREIDMALHRASVATFEDMARFYATNTKFQDALAPFKKEFIFTRTNSVDGKVQLPKDYKRLLSISLYKYSNETQSNNEIPVAVVNDDEKSARLKSQLIPVTESSPIAQWVGIGAFQLYPKKPNVGSCWYLKQPAKPKYAVTFQGRVRTYDEQASTQLEWQEGEINRVMYRALQFLGINLSDEQMVQYTQLKLQEE